MDNGIRIPKNVDIVGAIYVPWDFGCKTNLLWNIDIDIRFDGTLRYGWKDGKHYFENQ